MGLLGQSWTKRGSLQAWYGYSRCSEDHCQEGCCLYEEAVAKGGGNFIVTLDQIQQLILEPSLDATEILVDDGEVWHMLFFNSLILEDFNLSPMVSNGNA